MKKILACGLILSTLMSIGSVCFAGKGLRIVDDSESEMEIEIDYPSSDDESEDGYDHIVKESQDYKEIKKPRKFRTDKQERSSIKKKDKKELTNLRNQAMALLSTGLYFADNFVYYSHKEISEMSIGDLNEDCTVLTVDGESKELPACVVEALRQYLAKRAELAPNTMGAEKPLFIDCRNPKQGLQMSAMGVNGGIREYRKANGEAADMEE